MAIALSTISARHSANVPSGRRAPEAFAGMGMGYRRGAERVVFMKSSGRDFRFVEDSEPAPIRFQFSRIANSISAFLVGHLFRRNTSSRNATLTFRPASVLAIIPFSNSSMSPSNRD